MTKFRIISLASSSEGNCFLVIAGEENFLIDLGIAPANLMRKLEFFKVNSLPSHVLISHEHWDHTSGINSFSKRSPVTIHANAPTFSRLCLEKGHYIRKETFNTGEVFSIGRTKIKPFHVHHDAAEPVGFSIIYRKHKVVYLLDTVRIDEKHMTEIADANLVIIDSNYDNLMLSQGKYPYSLKRRIAISGHLSNEATGSVILNHPNPATEFWLGHLSKENNSPTLASQTVNHILKNGKSRRKRFKILPRKSTGPFWEPPVEQYKLIPPVPF
jgi:phosphoribosyl 1,2-cyclic phosphodiesterase